MSQFKVFVCGVTGNQGGAAADALLSRGATVHTLSRDLSTAKSQAAATKGIKLFQGGYDNPESLAAALDHCDAAFVIVSPSFTDHKAELKQGSAIIAAAKAAGIRHIVYTSGLGCNEPEKLYHWDSNSYMGNMVANKQANEHQVRSSGFPYWTILRTGHLDSNYLSPQSPQFGDLYETGEWSNMLTKDTKMPVIDPATIGAFAAAAFYNPDRFHQQELPMAEELITLDEIMAKLSHLTGRQLRVNYYTDEEVETLLKVNTFFSAQVTMRNVSIFANIEQLKSFNVPLSSFDAYLEKNQDTVKEAFKL
ncbi:uncharacterized protein TRUGW13939_11982 [Talaromyces rugulosus]|uniref:NmrA-like domain-containing protein n=1 Tax=Talaromyces rugulosus TaxID=121627 RepID=A0A7H8REV2_TALRU|nr:uncharacterized protein TRUGW13939_11982 [Talaromyces rugulosus]QKX64806.1 hypothetical protein TRUGW13939_11982 [Talaromyces rugulosus]